MTDRELMQQALGYMESVGQMDMHPEEWAIAVALRERLAQPEQGPVFELGFGWLADATKYPRGTKLYATPPRQWQGLTDAEIKAPIQRAMQYFGYDPTQYSLGGAATIGFLGLVREIEAKLKEKNT